MNRLISAMILMLLVAVALPARADSPITSTPFHEAYLDVKIVKKAAESGVITGEIAAFLSDPQNPVDVKAAVVNALSWRFEGKNNAELFTWYLALKYDVPLDNFNLEILNSGELFSLGYLTVMDDYFQPQNALPILVAANTAWLDDFEKSTPMKKVIGGSFSMVMVQALVRAQIAMDANWCDVWQTADQVMDNEDLLQDMRPEAVDIIMDYMQGYEEYCG